LRAVLSAGLAATALALTPAVASAQVGGGGNPFGPLPPAQQAPPPTQTTPTPTTSNSNPNDVQVSTIGVFGLFIAGILVILLIGWFIMRDARRSLPGSKRRRANRKKKAAAAAASSAARANASGKRAPPPPPRRRAAARKKQRPQKRRAR
jgi:hypothetical protein